MHKKETFPSKDYFFFQQFEYIYVHKYNILTS